MKYTSFAVIAFVASSALASSPDFTRRTQEPSESEIDGYVAQLKQKYDELVSVNGEPQKAADVISHMKDAITSLQAEKRELSEREDASDVIRVFYDLGKSLPERRDLHAAGIQRRSFKDFLDTIKSGLEAFGKFIVSERRSLEELD